MSSSTSLPVSRDAHDRRRVFALWTGVLAGPVLSLVVLEVNYVLSYVACEVRQTWFLHLAAIAGIVLTAASGLWAWRAAHSPSDLPEPLTAPISPETCDGRMRWMAYAAAALSIWSIVVILSFVIPVVVLKTCQ